MSHPYVGWVIVSLLAVACGGSSSEGSGGSAGSGGVGGSGGSGAGGTGAVSGGGGSSGTYPRDPALDCPPKPYADPADAIVSQTPPALAWAAAVGGELPDGIDAVAPLPNGDLALALWRKDESASSIVLARGKSDGSLAWSHEWPGTGDRAVLGTSAAGNVFVASSATQPFDVAGTTIGGSASATFAYLIELDETGAVVSHQIFPFAGTLELRSMTVRADGEIALVGSITNGIDFGAGLVEVPDFMKDTLPASFVARFGADGAHLFSRVYPSSGVHNEPQALPGSGGTNGYGRSVAADVAWTPDDGLIVATSFQGAIDLGTTQLPNDDLPDAVVLKLDSAGTTVWHHHLHGLIGENIPGNTGGSAGFIPEGSATPARVAVSSQGRVAVTGPLTSRARLDGGTLLDGKTNGFFSVLLESDGSVVSAVADGGVDVAFDPSGQTFFWDGSALFGLQSGVVSFSLTPGGKHLSTKPGQLVTTGSGFVLAGSFFERLDLGSTTLESAGCADGFVAAFGQ